jgi:hypothetical protein
VLSVETLDLPNEIGLLLIVEGARGPLGHQSFAAFASPVLMFRCLTLQANESEG